MLRTVSRPGVQRSPKKGRTWYFAPDGDVANNGRSPKTPWTLQEITNYFFFNPLAKGDRLLLKGGATFNGGVYLGDEATPNLRKPPQFNTYGRQNATINAPLDNTLYFSNISIDWRNINVVGNSAIANQQAFLVFLSDNKQVQNLKILNCNISGAGIPVQLSGGANASYTNTLVQNVTIDSGIRNGLISNGATGIYSWTGKYRYLNVQGITGETANPSGGTGNGILIGNHSNSVIEWCYANGSAAATNGKANHLIWLFRCRDTVIRDCVAHSNRGVGFDRTGFGIDVDCDRCVVERCFSWDCWGGGCYLNHGTSNVIRHNLFVDCCYLPNASNSGVISITTPTAQLGIVNAAIHNNTIVVRPHAGGVPPAIVQVTTNNAFGVFSNNIVYWKPSAQTIALRASGRADGIRFIGNYYYAPDLTGINSIVGGTTTTGLSNLKTTHGFERMGGVDYEQIGNPLLVDAETGSSNAENYRLSASSPIGSGLDLPALLGITPGGKDFFSFPLNTVIPGYGADSSRSVVQYATPSTATQLLNKSVAYWRLDTGAWQDAKGIPGFTLAAQGTVATGAALAGNGSGSASFDGNSQLRLSNHTQLYAPTEFTIVLVFQKTLAVGTNGAAGLIGRWNTASNQREYWMRLEYPSGQGERVQFQYSTNGTSVTTVSSPYVAIRNQRRFAVIQRSLSQGFVRVSIDNGEFTTASFTGNIFQSSITTSVFGVGAGTDGASIVAPFTGLIDCVGFWDQILTSQELNTLWNNGNILQL